MARYPAAVWRGDGMPNHGGKITRVAMGVIHVMQGTLEGTDSWFHDPKAEVSAHFGVGKDGTVYQWVDTEMVAWAEAAYNDRAISIEHEGESGDSLTHDQINADVDLVRWIESVHGLPADRPHWFGHGELGVAGGAHPDCPGQPIMDDLPLILAVGGLPTPNPQPQPQTPTKEQIMDAIEINGQPFVYGVSPAGHPLQFYIDAQGKWQCVDLTDAVLANNPGSQPYTVQP